MESYLTPYIYDLVTPDGKITKIHSLDKRRRLATIKIETISPAFVGFQIEPKLTVFNLKSTLAQLGMNGIAREFYFEKNNYCAEVQVELIALGNLGEAMLSLLREGDYIGKLFAKDERRLVRDPDYLIRMFGRNDRKGRPLLSLGGLEGSGALILEKIEGRTVAFLSLLDGTLSYDSQIYNFLPTLAKALARNESHTRQLIHLHHRWEKGALKMVRPDEILLVRTTPLHIRTVYGHVVPNLLPQGFHHTSAAFLQPDTTSSGDIYELFGSSPQVIDDIPLEFFTLEPHREHVFFADRDQLLFALDNPKSLFDAFATAPKPESHLAAVFVSKGSQMQELKENDWIAREAFKHDFTSLSHPMRQAQIVEKFIEYQPAYPFLKAIEEGLITSQGVLLVRHFPSPFLKRMLLNELVGRCLKRIYFQHPSSAHDQYFSHEDRTTLTDLAKFGIPVYWVDQKSEHILQFVFRIEKEAGLFVPLPLVESFEKATIFGVYGSHLIESHFEKELFELLKGAKEIFKKTPLALVTGGGQGAMEAGNRAAKSLGIISCANLVDFSTTKLTAINKQRENRYIEAKMTYRLDQLVERQAEFNLDFPIFLPGGIGMDFEYSLEEVRRATGSSPPAPVLLFGDPAYWKNKITPRFQLNCETGTICGSEWISNCFYCIQTAKEGLWVLSHFFAKTLPIGQDGPIYENGFCIVKERIN